MKNSIAIILLTLLLYHLMGYAVLFHARQYSLEREISIAIDNGQINEEDLIEIKIPVPVYHQTNKGFERMEGRFEYKGKFYELVKMKVENDTIYTYSLNNEKKADLYQKLSEHIQTHIIDRKGDKPAKSAQFVAGFLKEYLSDTLSILPARCWQSFEISLTDTPYLFSFLFPSPSLVTPPPRVV